MTLKLKLYQLCNAFIENKLYTINKTIKELEESLLSETKSSAGDKHETGRAMVQLEREKIGRQLAEIDKMKILLNKVQIDNKTNVVTLGSLVYTNQLNYFIAISAGEFIIDNTSFFTISSNTPIGKLLIGKTSNDMVLFNGKQIQIKKIE